MQDEYSHNASSRTVSVADGTGPLGPVDLPLRELNENANLEEYTRETASGKIPKRVPTNDGGMEDYKLVTFKEDDPDNPKNWSKLFKWYITMVVAFTCFVVALASSVVTADFPGVMESFNVSREVALLTVTVFVIGFGVGMFSPISPCQDSKLIHSRSYGICSDVRNGGTPTGLRGHVICCSYLRHPLRGGPEHRHSYRLQSD